MRAGPRPQKLSDRMSRLVERRSEPRERIDPRAQFIGERLPVADRGDRGEGDGRPDHDREAGPDAGLDLVEDERKAQRQAEVAGDLEETAVLAAEPDRDD